MDKIMALNKHQLRDLIERVLREIHLYSDAAVNLLMGTAAQESAFGSYLKQLGNGPAKGAFQMERLTFDDLQGRFGKVTPEIMKFRFDQLEWDLRASIIMARIKYYSIPENLPLANDIQGLARYWKRWYNTPLGHGTEQEFIDSYKKYVA
jgi:hypothetical protein